MCWECMDADKRNQALANKACDGELEPFITTGELIERLTLEWAETKKRNFQFYRKGIINSHSDALSWVATMGATAAPICVQLV
jgi:hypothetical protein